MTIRKLWLAALSSIVVISVLMSTILLAGLTDNSNTRVYTERYRTNVNDLILSLEQLMATDELSQDELRNTLKLYIQEPITEIEIFSNAGVSLSNIKSPVPIDLPKYEEDDIDIQDIPIIDGDTLLGTVRITRLGPPENQTINHLFIRNLLLNSIIAVSIALLLSLAFGIIISSLMTRSLRETAELANDLQVGDSSIPAKTNIREINAIRDILYDYHTRLRMRQQSRKALLDELVHQSRTPLTVLQIHLEGIEEGLMEVTPEEMDTLKDQIEQVTSVISHMSEMIDDEKEVQELIIEEFEFHHFIKHIHNGLSFQFKKKNITFELETAQRLALRTDKHKLNQILYNLLTNAYKYTDRDGTVSISYTSDEQRLSIIVKDTGVGISSEDTSKIFQAYYRADQTKHIGGEGIGLYIAQEHAKILGGSISIESVVGRGSLFTLSIPIECGKSS